jgi:hypothetical protein
MSPVDNYTVSALGIRLEFESAIRSKAELHKARTSANPMTANGQERTFQLLKFISAERLLSGEEQPIGRLPRIDFY